VSFYPQDIRSYFTPVATSQKRNSEPVAPKSQKRRVISSDEDEEKPKSSAKRSKVLSFVIRDLYLLR